MLSDFYFYGLKIKLKYIRIHLLYICLILRLVERLVLTDFLAVFLILKDQKDRDYGPVFIQFSPVWSPVFYQSLRLDLETLLLILENKHLTATITK